MIDKMNHYAFTNPPTVYDEEALTALELAARMGGKVNECIEYLNHIGGEFEKVEELIKNVPETVKNAVENEIAGIDFANLSLEEGSVDASKLANHIMPVDVHITAAVYNTPLLFIDLVAHTVSVNTEITEPYTIYTRGKDYTFTPQELTANIEEFLETGSEAFSLFYDPETKTIFIASFDDAATNTLKKYLFLGRLNVNRLVNTLKIPVEVNGEFVGVSSGGGAGSSTLRFIKPHYINMRRTTSIENVVFDYNSFQKTITLVKGGVYNVYLGNEVVTIDFDSANYHYDTNIDNDVCYLIFNKDNNTISMTADENAIDKNCVFLGYINRADIYKSDCIIPFSINSTYIYNPIKNIRETATIYCEYANANYGRTIPYIEFEYPDCASTSASGKWINNYARLTFPNVRAVYVVTCDEYRLIKGESGGEPFDYVIDVGSGLNYIMAGEKGIKALSALQFFSDVDQYGSNQSMYFLGTVNAGTRSFNLNFECVPCGTVSILGDSISTNEGDIPSNHPTYYHTDRQNCWWDKACRGAGLKLIKNASYSGLLVSDTRDTVYNGKELAKQLYERVQYTSGVGNYLDIEPDNIIIYLGINDYQLNVAVDDATKGFSISMDSKFATDYLTMIWNAQQICPNAKIFLCTLPPAKCFNKGIGNLDSNGSGKFIVHYNWVIMRLAELTGCEVIRLDECGFNLHNGASYMWDYNETTGDFLHPNARGHSMIANKVIQSMYHGAKRQSDMHRIEANNGNMDGHE